MSKIAVVLSFLLLVVASCLGSGRREAPPQAPTASGPVEDDQSAGTLAMGQNTFRFETFGGEAYWTDQARMHEVIAQSVSPTLALKSGLKVDSEVIPEAMATALKGGRVDLDDPATTVALLKLNAIVGLHGKVESRHGEDELVEVGITCALCHSTVDDSFMPGMGRRQDGWPNRDLDVGAIIALSPALTPEQKAIYSSWGPGKYDPRYNQDGQSTPLVLPPTYGLAGVTHGTYTGEGSMSYWNAYVAVTQMHGQGNFFDARLGVDVRKTPDQVAEKLPALRAYQHSLQTPKPPAGSFDAVAAARGKTAFAESCVGCHVSGTGTDNNTGTLHAPEVTGMDGSYAARTTTKRYRTTPLRGLWQHPPYFHDGSAATLAAVVDHYDHVRNLKLEAGQRSDLVEYLKSL